MIVVRRFLAESSAALAGGMVEISSARLIASMAAFNEERALSRPFGRWDLVAMVETQGGCKKAVQRAGREEESKP